MKKLPLKTALGIGCMAFTGFILATSNLIGQIDQMPTEETWASHPHMHEDSLPSMLEFPHQPYINWNPGPEYDNSKRMFQGIPSVAVAPGGERLWATWYGGGTGEGPYNYIMLATSGDGGETWSDIRVVIDPPYRASEPAVWVDPNGVLWWMWNQYPHTLLSPSSQLWVMTTENPDDENPVWDSPRIIAKEMNNFNKPTVLRDGRWLWPSGSWQWRTAHFEGPRQPLGHLSRPLFSEDDGETFYYGGRLPTPPELNAFDEYQVVEREDGVLWLLNRMREYGIGQSFSYDGGETWTDFESAGIKHTTSRFFFGRLESGNLLLVKNGPLDEDVGRSQLMAFLSKDDGDTWVGGLMLDERSRVSYPDADQGPDGTIYVIYDRERHVEQEILLARFTESDVIAGEPVSDQARFKIVINKGTGINPRFAPEETVESVSLIQGASPDLDIVGEGNSLKIEPEVPVFTDRDFVWNEAPEFLQGKRFGQMSIHGGRVTVTAPGVLYVLTPLPWRNTDSVQNTLFRQGFTLVDDSDFPEFSLFDHVSRNTTLCRLYQREVAAGDEVSIGKWGVFIY